MTRKPGRPRKPAKVQLSRQSSCLENTPTVAERRLEAAVKAHKAAPSLETWHAVYKACAACLGVYGRLPSYPSQQERAVMADLQWRGIDLFDGLKTIYT